MSRRYAGRLRTEEGIERRREYDRRRNAERNRRRVFGASGYLGYAPTEEHASHLNEMGRELRDRQKQS